MIGQDVTTPEIIAKVHKMVLEYGSLKVREIAEGVGRSSGRGVSRLLTQEQKRIRVKKSEECFMFACYQRNQQDFFASVCDHRWKMSPVLYTIDKTTVKAVEKCWFSPQLMKAKAIRLAGNVMAVSGMRNGFCWYIIFHLVKQLRGNTMLTSWTNNSKDTRKRPALARKKVLFHQNNARIHVALPWHFLYNWECLSLCVCAHTCLWACACDCDVGPSTSEGLQCQK